MNNIVETYTQDMKFIYDYFSAPKLSLLFVTSLSQKYWNMYTRDNFDWGDILDDLPRIKRLYE